MQLAARANSLTCGSRYRSSACSMAERMVLVGQKSGPLSLSGVRQACVGQMAQSTFGIKLSFLLICVKICDFSSRQNFGLKIAYII